MPESAWLAAAGFLLISGLAVRKIPGAIILGVLAVTVAAVALGLEPWHGIFAAPPSLAPTFPKMDLAGAFQLSLVTIVLTLLLVTMLDTAGTLIGVARQARLLDKEGRLPRLRQALLANSGAAMLGAALGTSTNTAYIESAAGVEEGGRTGLTAIFVALFFLLALFLAPLAQTVPLYHGTRAPVRRGSWPRWSNAGDAAVNVPRIQPLSRRSPLAIRAQPLSPQVDSMDTEVPKESPRHGANVVSIFITSLAAAIVVAGGFGIVFQAGIVAAAARLGLGTSFVWFGSAINAAITLWLAAWTFARSWHVERRLKAGLEVDEPKLSILANFRGS